MLDSLHNNLKKHKGDYRDIRWEKREVTRITYIKNELKTIGTSTMTGGSIRVVDKGGMASSVFSRIEDIGASLDWSHNAAVSMVQNNAKSIKWLDAPIHEDNVTVNPEKNPKTISLSEKKALVDAYNDIILSHPKIQSSQVAYRENNIKKYFVNSEGTKIEQENLIVRLSCRFTAKKNGLTQDLGITFGGSPDYNRLLNREKDLKNKLEMAVALLDAQPVKAGLYHAILDNELTGVFVHEAFGHLSEADIVLRNRELKDTMYIGRELGSPILNISDDSTLENTPGYFVYDDDGVAGTKTFLIKNGILNSRLHSRETAAEFNESLTGNSRAGDHSYSPAVRMSNIFIEPGKSTRKELLASIQDGLYLIGIRGGQTIGDQFSFGAEYGYLVKNGKLQNLVRDINVSGNLFSTLKNIDAIGNDLQISERGGCGKGTEEGIQMLDKSGIGGPHISIKGVTIGGSA